MAAPDLEPGWAATPRTPAGDDDVVDVRGGKFTKAMAEARIAVEAIRAEAEHTQQEKIATYVAAVRQMTRNHGFTITDAHHVLETLARRTAERAAKAAQDQADRETAMCAHGTIVNYLGGRYVVVGSDTVMGRALNAFYGAHSSVRHNEIRLMSLGGGGSPVSTTRRHFLTTATLDTGR